MNAERIHSLSSQCAAVVGGSRSGIAAARLLASNGARVFLTERDRLTDENRELLEKNNIDYEESGHTKRSIDDADFVVMSPGVPTSIPLVQETMNRGIPVYSEIEVASWFCAAPVVAITGSNGKTTTTSLAAHSFNLSGRETYSGGNIGLPFSTFCEKAGPEAVVILEVSSFQLDHIDTFKPQVSVLLNITPDHLDRYDDDFNKYAASKLRIMENQTEGDSVVFNVDDPETRRRSERAANFDRVKNFAFGVDDHDREGAFVRDEHIVIRINQEEEELMHVKEMALRGQHNLYNTLAAAVAARVLEVRSEVIRESVGAFEGVPHRLEPVGEIDGVKYFNDSKATNVNAVWYALESFNEPIILIAGGQDKGNDYSSIVPLVRDKVKILIALGEGAPTIIDELGDLVETVTHVEEMEDAVRFARVMAEPGEVVLLSPACASFDMFKNYEHRGDVFRDLVNKLTTE